MNNIIIPYKYRLFFFSNSLWLLIPIYKSYYINKYLFINLIQNLIFSLLHWYYYKHNSYFHNLDKIYSTNTFIIITYYSKNKYIYYLYPLMLYFFFIGRKNMIKKNYKKHFINHLLFRYIGFWICCIYLEYYSIKLLIKFTLLLYINYYIILISFSLGLNQYLR
jgi:hypothetical protein